MLENGYSYSSNRWALDRTIKNEIQLLLILSCLCSKYGYCIASNEYLGDLFGLKANSISKKLSVLKSKGYIKAEYVYRGAEIVSRKIWILEFSDSKNRTRTDSKNGTDKIRSNKKKKLNKKGMKKSTINLSQEQIDEQEKLLFEYENKLRAIEYGSEEYKKLQKQDLFKIVWWRFYNAYTFTVDDNRLVGTIMYSAKKLLTQKKIQGGNPYPNVTWLECAFLVGVMLKGIKEDSFWGEMSMTVQTFSKNMNRFFQDIEKRKENG